MTDVQKQEIRDWCDRVIVELDVLEHHGLKRDWVKRQVGKIRKHLSNYARKKKGKWMPTVAELHQELCGTPPSQTDILHFLHAPQHHSYHREWIRVVKDRLTFIQRYEGPRRATHPKYGEALHSGNWATWIDQYGLNALDSQRRDALRWREQYRAEHGKLPYKHDVVRSDPTPEVT